MTVAYIFQYGLIPSMRRTISNRNSLLLPRDQVSGVGTLGPANPPTIET
jgi:hypothetical protein